MNPEDELAKRPTMNEKWKTNLHEALADVLKKGQEQRYLEGLAKSFHKDRPENYLLARSIIIDIHLSIEFALNWIVLIVLRRGVAGIREGMSLSKTTLIFIQEMPFTKRLDLVETFNVYSSKAVSYFRKINNIRNSFAHVKYGKQEFNYKGLSIFIQKGIEALIGDYDDCRKELLQFLVDTGYLEKSELK